MKLKHLSISVSNVSDLIRNDLVTFLNENGKYELQGGSLHSIIRSLIDFKSFTEDHIESIIVTHGYWTTSHYIIEELILMFWLKTNHLLSSLEIDPKETHWKQLIRKRIAKIFYIWISEYSYLLDSEAKNLLIDFILNLKQTQALSKPILNILAKSLKQALNTIPSPKNSVLKPNSKHLDFLEVTPKDLAKQITLYDSKRLSTIKTRHFARYFKDKKNAIYETLERSKSVQKWILTEILTSKNIHLVSIKISNFIQLCQYCLDLHNYHTAYDIYKSLQDPRIQQLAKTWNELNKDLLSIWETISLQLSSEADFFDMAIEASVPKVMPLQLIVKYFTALEKEPRYVDKTTTINFSKYKAMYQILKPLLESHQSQYSVEENQPIQSFLNSAIVCLPNDVLNVLSKEIVLALSDREPFESTRTNRTPKKRSQGSFSARERKIERINVPRKTTSTNTVTQTIISKCKSGQELQTLIHDETKLKWARPLSKCSVGQDLPRFAKKITIVHENNIIYGSQYYDDESNVPNVIKDLLFSLAVQLSAKKELKAMENSFPLYFGKVECDILKESDRFAKEILGDDSKMSKLLKAACTQGIVSPAWIKLKLDILAGFPFKDAKKGWNIAIVFNANEIIVVHRKREISVNEKDEVMFQFTWELSMKFTKKMDAMISSMLNIVDMDIRHMPDKKAVALKAAVKYWYNPKLECFPTFQSKKHKRRSIGDLKKVRSKTSFPL